jgi:hypothetical protein
MLKEDIIEHKKQRLIQPGRCNLKSESKMSSIPTRQKEKSKVSCCIYSFRKTNETVSITI